MTTNPFTDAARAEAEGKYLYGRHHETTYTDYAALREQFAFAAGAEWARDHLAAQEPTDAEAQAYLAAFSADLPPDTVWTPDTIARVKRGLRVVRAARRDEEKRDG